MARWRPPRRQLRDELRGRLGALRAGRRRLFRIGPDRDAQPLVHRQRTRSRGRGHVRIRQPRRLLAADAPVRGTRAADDRVRLRARHGAQRARLRRDQGRRSRRLLARLALDQAFRTHRGRGARAHPQGGRLVQADDRLGAGRLVLPLWAEREHPPPRRRTRRLPLRQRLLWRRAAVLEDGARPAAPDRAVHAHPQRREVCRLDQHVRRLVLVRARRLPVSPATSTGEWQPAIAGIRSSRRRKASSSPISRASA